MHEFNPSISCSNIMLFPLLERVDEDQIFKNTNGKFRQIRVEEQNAIYSVFVTMKSHHSMLGRH